MHVITPQAQIHDQDQRPEAREPAATAQRPLASSGERPAHQSPEPSTLATQGDGMVRSHGTQIIQPSHPTLVTASRLQWTTRRPDATVGTVAVMRAGYTIDRLTGVPGGPTIHRGSGTPGGHRQYLHSGGMQPRVDHAAGGRVVWNGLAFQHQGLMAHCRMCCQAFFLC